MIDLAGHVAYLFVAVGMFLLSKKSKWGWVCRFTGEIGWVIIGLIMGMTSIWMWGLLFMALDFNGFHAWRRMEKSNADQDQLS